MTIKDIARISGYAVGTVSRALNNQPNVSETARKRILEVAEEYNFVRNTNAQQLKQHGKNLVILVKGVSNILLNTILEIIQKRIGETTYTSSVFVLDEMDNEAKAALKIYYEKKPAGIIFLGGNPERYEADFNKIKVPCVLITNQAQNVKNKNFSSVGTDDRKAAELITTYLIKNGHRKIGVIGGDVTNSEISERRYNGFLTAVKAAGLDFDFDTQYQTAKYSFEGGAAAAEQLLAKSGGITAVFTMSDVQAIGAIRKFNDLGYSVPEDIPVTGFDGLSLTQFLNPRLTTIKQYDEKLADSGVSALLSAIADENDHSEHILVPFEFLKGESVRKIN
ncbi:MAG: LacI family DNA-binding transcriptional regulator [Eubacteriales bacterium]|nr:LacI family DNA-binding transcriptional regulator [Eubacteriales bacterium]